MVKFLAEVLDFRVRFLQRSHAPDLEFCGRFEIVAMIIISSGSSRLWILFVKDWQILDIVADVGDALDVGHGFVFDQG